MSSQTSALQQPTSNVTAIIARHLRSSTERYESIDLLRGIVMVVMALDHIRDFMTWRAIPPEVLESHNSFALFFTRFVTHYCAPTFFFLAGTGAFLMLARRSKAELSRFLWTRGLWLLFVECTIVRLAWTFVPYPATNLSVIFALGVCMIILSALIHLPTRWLAVFSLTVIAGHNLLDSITSRALPQPWNRVWQVMHEPGYFNPATRYFHILYPIVPWFAVMAIGYCFGAVIKSPRETRIRRTAMIGAAATFLFVALRGINGYGNGMTPGMLATGHWRVMSTPLMTLASFLNVTKYPPSLDYLLVTLGPALLALAAFDQWKLGNGWIGSKFVVFGRVPMFYYLCHLYVVHLVALLFATLYHQPAEHLGWNGGGYVLGTPQPGFGFNLPMIYFGWILSIVILYFPCAWYARYKAEHKQNVWLSYL